MFLAAMLGLSLLRNLRAVAELTTEDGGVGLDSEQEHTNIQTYKLTSMWYDVDMKTMKA